VTRRVVQDVTVHDERPAVEAGEDYPLLDSVAGDAPEPRRQAPEWELLAEVDLCGCTRQRQCPQHRQASSRQPRLRW
jgi:hypothetical protein